MFLEILEYEAKRAIFHDYNKFPNTKCISEKKICFISLHLSFQIKRLHILGYLILSHLLDSFICDHLFKENQNESSEKNDTKSKEHHMDLASPITQEQLLSISLLSYREKPCCQFLLAIDHHLV